MPKSKNYNNWIKQAYPRKCEHCDYVSNNPSMYHYHKKTHDPIPKDQLCDHGCGRPALYRGTGGKYTCEKKFSLCPQYLLDLAERTKLSWVDDTQRKEQTRLTIESRLNTTESIEKRKQTLKKKWGNFTPEQIKDYRHYARRIRQRAQRWAKSQGHILGQQTYHVDHKLSIWDSWQAGLSEDIVNHPANLQILDAKTNAGKGAKSCITIEELLNAINPTSLRE